MMERPFSCIIPAYNEVKYIGGVLNEVKNTDLIGQLICVDDGSTDGTADLIAREFPDIILLRQQRNSGKSAAVRRGLKAATKPNVILLDADLRGLRSGEIDEAAEAFLSMRPDMIILRRMGAPWRLRWSRIDTLLAGERIMRTNDLRRLLTTVVKDYELELAINLYMLNAGKTVYWAPSSATNTFKFEKLPALKGIGRELRMYLNLIGSVSPVSLARMIMQFGREKVPLRQDYRWADA